jgi:hypothetical protein
LSDASGPPPRHPEQVMGQEPWASFARCLHSSRGPARLNIGDPTGTGVRHVARMMVGTLVVGEDVAHEYTGGGDAHGLRRPRHVPYYRSDRGVADVSRIVALKREDRRSGAVRRRAGFGPRLVRGGKRLVTRKDCAERVAVRSSWMSHSRNLAKKFQK